MTRNGVGSGQELREQLLEDRRKDWQGRGRYTEPLPPREADLPNLPTNWVWVSPEALSSADRHALAIGPFGSNLKVSDYTDSGVPLVFVKNIRAGRFGGDGTVYVSPAKAAELSAHKVSAGDILITKMGDPPGDACLYPALTPDAIITADCIKLRLARRLKTPRFFVYAINSPAVRSQILGITKGVAQLKVSLGRFSTIGLPLPSLAEQRSVVEEIDKQFTRLDAGVAALRRVQANLKRYRGAVLKAACEGRLVPTEAELARKEGRTFETGADLVARILTERRHSWQGRGPYKELSAAGAANPFDLPAGWTWTTLDALAQIKGGITKDQGRKHSAPTRSVPYLRVANVQRGRIDLTKVKQIVTTEEEIRELALRPGDILFNEGGDRDKLGRGWVWNGELPECIHQNHVFRARLYVATLNPRFVSWYANTFGQKFFFDEGKHTTNLASISMSKLKNLPVPIPPPSEQVRIVAEVERRLSVLDEIDATATGNLQRATRLRQSVLQAAFSPE